MTTPLKSLSDLKPGSLNLDELVKSLRSKNQMESANAGLALVRDAAAYGVNVKEYLMIACGKDAKDPVGLNGYERALFALNMPVRNDYANGIHLQLASDTFQTFPGTRALFPLVIDEVLRFAARQDQFEKVAPMLAGSRSIAGPELLSTVVDDDTASRDSQQISEGGRIPVRSIRTSEKTVKIWKHGSAIRMTYEFSRRAALDLLTPHANRMKRQLEISKVAAATAVLINGDGEGYSASPVVNQSDYNTVTGLTATNGQIGWAHMLYWIVSRARIGVPMDTVLMNWDGWFQWLMLFGKQTVGAATYNFGARPAENLAAAGAAQPQTPAGINLALQITPVISSAMPANKLLGYSKGDTLEELVEAGSQISESERAITNQTVTYVVTENTGYRLVYGDTRSIFNFGA